MSDQSVNESVQATEIQREASGATVEYTDVRLLNGTYWKAPPKVCRGDALLAFDKEECGTATRLCLDLLVDNWDQVMFGPCLEGAVFELQQERRPERVSMLDGYLTLFLGVTGDAHFHLCTDVHRGLGREGADPVVAKRRQCSRVSFYREFGAGRCVPGSWGVRLWNGDGDQMCTFFLPNPFLNAEQKLQTPDWSRLSLWNELRARYLGETMPQPIPKEAPVDSTQTVRAEVREIDGPDGLEQTRYGDWERKGRAIDF